MGFWRNILGKPCWPFRKATLADTNPCIAAFLDWQASLEHPVYMCWYWPDRQHWRIHRPGQKHCVGYWLEGSNRHYWEPQRDCEIELSENELSLAQHIGP